MTNFCGYDIAPDMVRLSRVNLYLHGFPQPVIHEYDTLTSVERWDERYDVIMANPPFMAPKGGIRPHNRFSIKANRSEVLFVDYIAEHLNPGGRAGVIVPEGIIFQSQNAYKNLRRMLVENYLWAVVSLPGGIFNPYAGVKTSILFLDRNLARRTDAVLFVKVENDGFDLGAQRRPIAQNNLPAALDLLQAGRRSSTSSIPSGPLAHAVSRQRLLESPDCNLSGDRYRDSVRVSGKWPMVKLGDVCKQDRELVEPHAKRAAALPYFSLEDIESETGRILKTPIAGNSEEGKSTSFRFDKRHVLYGKLRPYLNKVALPDFEGRCTTELIPLLPSERLNRVFLAYVLRRKETVAHAMQGKTGSRMPRADMEALLSFEIPLPALAEQERLVAEWEGYRKVIEAARQVVAHYKPTLRIDPTWPRRPVSEIASLEYGLTTTGRESGDARLIRITDITDDGMLSEAAPKYTALDDEGEPYLLRRDDILVARTGATYGKALIIDTDEPAVFASYLIRLRFKGETLPRFYWFFAQADDYWNQARALVTGGGQPQFNGNALKKVELPLPPLDVQRQIVAELEAERSLVEANRELIARMERKLQASLAEVWGEEGAAD